MPTGTGHSISDQEFWKPMQKALAAKGWKPIINIPGFPIMAEKDRWVIGMVDAHLRDATAAFYELDRWIEGQNVAPSRLLVAVFYVTSKSEIETIKGLRRGNRMGTQAVAGVIHIQGGEFYAPKPAEWNALGGLHNEPDFKDEIGDEIQDALKKTLGPH